MGFLPVKGFFSGIRENMIETVPDTPGVAAKASSKTPGAEDSHEQALSAGAFIRWTLPRASPRLIVSHRVAAFPGSKGATLSGNIGIKQAGRPFPNTPTTARSTPLKEALKKAPTGRMRLLMVSKFSCIVDAPPFLSIAIFACQGIFQSLLNGTLLRSGGSFRSSGNQRMHVDSYVRRSATTRARRWRMGLPYMAAASKPPRLMMG